MTGKEKSTAYDSGQQHATELPCASVVIIGRNEAASLPDCIRSIEAMDYPQDRLEVMYVDTDSTDGSPDVVRSLGVEVHQERSDFPSPGRARNRGWREAKHGIVHFVDGDTTVDPHYLRKAVRYLGLGGIVCVIGRLQERHSVDSLLTRILEYPWRVKEFGFVDGPGAGGVFLTSVLQEIGGYNPYLLRGQETEMGNRLRACGYRILLLNETMGTHDYEIRDFSALWARYQNIGRSLAKVLQLPFSASIAAERRAARRTLIQGIFAPLALAGFVFFRMWGVVLALPFLLALYVVIRYWQPAYLRSLRIAYFTLEYFLKPAIWLGMVQYVITHWTSRRRYAKSS